MIAFIRTSKRGITFTCGYRAAAYAEDGTLEAMEADGDRFEVAVQWHPETRDDAGLFAGLVAAAAARLR